MPSSSALNWQPVTVDGDKGRRNGNIWMCTKSCHPLIFKLQLLPLFNLKPSPKLSVYQVPKFTEMHFLKCFLDHNAKIKDK